MDPDSDGAEKSFSIFSESINPFAFVTSTVSCSLLLFSCHATPDERLLQAIAKKTDTARTKAPVVQTAKLPKKKIYLTFDDGPNKGTDSVVWILKEAQVPATLFVIGEQVYGSRAQTATWQSLLQCDNIEVCNHSYTHAHNQFTKFYTDPTAVVNDFERCKDSLNLINNIARTPGRNIWRTQTISLTDLDKTKPAADSVQQSGFTLVGWDVEWHYTPPNLLLRESADEMLRQIDSLLTSGKTRQKDHLVLLAHDQTFEDRKDAASLRYLLQQLQLRGDYELEKISAYPGVSGQKPNE
jgi:peptidoglycan-N-acetylglucosamine deacetylase